MSSTFYQSLSDSSPSLIIEDEEDLLSPPPTFYSSFSVLPTTVTKTTVLSTGIAREDAKSLLCYNEVKNGAGAVNIVKSYCLERGIASPDRYFLLRFSENANNLVFTLCLDDRFDHYQLRCNYNSETKESWLAINPVLLPDGKFKYITEMVEALCNAGFHPCIFLDRYTGK